MDATAEGFGEEDPDISEILWVLYNLYSFEVLQDDTCQTLLGPTEYVDDNIRRGIAERRRICPLHRSRSYLNQT